MSSKETVTQTRLFNVAKVPAGPAWKPPLIPVELEQLPTFDIAKPRVVEVSSKGRFSFPADGDWAIAIQLTDQSLCAYRSKAFRCIWLDQFFHAWQPGGKQPSVDPWVDPTKPPGRNNLSRSKNFGRPGGSLTIPQAFKWFRFQEKERLSGSGKQLTDATHMWKFGGLRTLLTSYTNPPLPLNQRT